MKSDDFSERYVTKSDSESIPTPSSSPQEKRKSLDAAQWNTQPLERLDLTSQALGGVLYDWDAQAGRVVRSSGLKNLLGFQPEEADAQDGWWNERIHPEDRERVKKAFEEGNRNCQVEYRIKHRDGHYVHVWDQALIIRDPSGKIQRIVGSNLDISQHKQIQAELQRAYDAEKSARENAEAANEVLERILSVKSALAQATTLAEIGASALPTLASLLGCDQALLVTINQREKTAAILSAKGLALPDCNTSYSLNASGAPCYLAKAINGRTPMVIRIGFRGDESIPLLPGLDLSSQIRCTTSSAIHIRPLLIGERVIGALAFIIHHALPLESEITHAVEILTQSTTQALERTRLFEAERAHREQAERANRAKDEFFAMVSHELRSPLQSILGWIKLVRSSKLDVATSARALEVMERNTRAQVQLVADLLEASRIITGRIAVDLQPVSIESAIETAIESIRPTAQNKGITLRAEYSAQLPVVLGDANRLQQVLWNLLSNAIKFTPSGGSVTILTRTVGAHLEVSVSDTGDGISPAFLPHVFDRFAQASEASATVHGGLGLGLSIVRHLIELHGGTAFASSRGLGMGSTFSFRLPLSQEFAVSPELEKIDSQLRSPSVAHEFNTGQSFDVLKDIRILLVDDTEDCREFFKTALNCAGAHVTSASSAKEAYAAISKEIPSILVSDIGLVGESGVDLIKHVRQTLSAEQLPAIAVTAFARPEDRQRVIEAGFQGYLAKPVEAEALISEILQFSKKAH